MHGDSRVGGAEEAEDRVATIVEQGGGEGERRVVGSLEPQLEHDGGLNLALERGLRLLVESEAEQPGGAGAALEAAIDPVGDPPLERPEPGVKRQLRLDRGEAVEEELRRARTVAHEPVAEPYSGFAQPVARDLIDGAGVEVLDERVTVAVERARAHGGQRACDPVECLLHGLVDRRTPVGEPGLAAVLELRVDEPLRDRSRRQLEDRERRAGGAAELDSSRPLGGERDQLGEADPSRARALSEPREIGDRGDAEAQLAGRQRAVGRALEHGRAEILLPQDLERRRLGAGVGLNRLGCGHEPFRIRVEEEVATSSMHGCRVPAHHGARSARCGIHSPWRIRFRHERLMID